MVCSDNEFWLKDPMVLIKCPLNLWPFSKNLPQPAGPFNALSRLLIIASIVFAVFTLSLIPIAVGVVGLIVIAAYYEIKYGSSSSTMEMATYNQGGVMQNDNPNGDLDTQKLEFGKATTLDGDCTPYGNPNPYQKCIASDQKPLGCMNTPVYGDQFIDKLYNGPQMIAPGLNFNRVPDTTTMARAPYPLTSLDAITKWVGLTDNIGTPSMR